MLKLNIEIALGKQLTGNIEYNVKNKIADKNILINIITTLQKVLNVEEKDFKEIETINVYSM